MKNKKLMYALLVVSALVWGWVFVKIFTVVFKQENTSVPIAKAKRKSEHIEQKDTFELLANYGDPFIKRRRITSSYEYGVSNSTVNTGQVIKKKQVAKPVKEEKIIDWSFINYKGRIIRKSTGKTLSLINIGGGDYSLEDGKEVQQVLLVKSYPDSIQVKFDGVKKNIKRNQN
ncbi:MAG: hypothetical protein H7282_14755 [Cytophagaceae bacterium]|nr:hypothetical protein [Cytophagaceae bacterium]